MKSKFLLYILPIISFLGFIDASYLTAKHYLETPVTCSIFEGCEKVTTSSYAIVFGIPVALSGIIFYLTIFILSIAFIEIKNKKLLSFIFIVASLGFAASLWFVYLQLFVIGAICLYCVLSAFFSTIIFILSIFMIKLKKNIFTRSKNSIN